MLKGKGSFITACNAEKVYQLDTGFYLYKALAT